MPFSFSYGMTSLPYSGSSQWWLKIEMPLVCTVKPLGDLSLLTPQIVMVPYLRSGSAVQVMRESEAADIIAAVAGLIRIFKKKLWTLPSSHAIQAYGILISCLEYHYRSQALLDSVPRVRLQVRGSVEGWSQISCLHVASV